MPADTPAARPSAPPSDPTPPLETAELIEAIRVSVNPDDKTALAALDVVAERLASQRAARARAEERYRELLSAFTVKHPLRCVCVYCEEAEALSRASGQPEAVSRDA